ncbi:hypothetical protein D3C77_617250 [compost metagenome]
MSPMRIGYPVFEIVRILSVLQHIHVVIGLNDVDITFHHLQHIHVDLTRIKHHAGAVSVAVLDRISNWLISVVVDFERIDV